jgi:hypothetical protein
LKGKTILFFHGLESSPLSEKAKFLATTGHHIVTPWLPSDDWEEALKVAQECVDAYKPDIIVGSSRGGAVALNIKNEKKNSVLILIAPAWRKYGNAFKTSPKTTILHSKKDQIIPYTDSARLAAKSGCNLHEVGSSHRMNEGDVYEMIEKLIRE